LETCPVPRPPSTNHCHCRSEVSGRNAANSRWNQAFPSPLSRPLPPTKTKTCLVCATLNPRWNQAPSARPLPGFPPVFSLQRWNQALRAPPLGRNGKRQIRGVRLLLRFPSQANGFPQSRVLPPKVESSASRSSLGPKWQEANPGGKVTPQVSLSGKRFSSSSPQRWNQALRAPPLGRNGKRQTRVVRLLLRFPSRANSFPFCLCSPSKGGIKRFALHPWAQMARGKPEG
jgi:hypothetical protein